MPTLSELLNAPSDFEYGEGAEKRIYKLREPTLLECGKYTRWLKEEARAAAAQSIELPEEDRRNLLRDVTADIAAQVYDWGGLVCTKSIGTPTGTAKLLSILCEDQGVTFELAKEIVLKRLDEVRHGMGLLYEEDPSGKAMEALEVLIALAPNFSITLLSSFVTRLTELQKASSDSST